MPSSAVLSVTPIVAGRAQGRLLLLDEALSLWGGLDPATGQIIDQHHPQSGEVVSGRIVVMPSGRGSSSASSVLVESIRRDTAPAALVLAERDEILALGALVGIELYQLVVPVAIVPRGQIGELSDGDYVELDGATLRRMDAIPEGYELVRTTEEFSPETVPKGILRAHQVADGVWGRLLVRRGSVGFVFEDDADSVVTVAAGAEIVIPPRQLHHVEPHAGSAFVVEFYCQAGVDDD